MATAPTIECKPDWATDAEFAFLRRMLPHFMSGKSAAESAEAVLEDDNRIINKALSSAHGWIGFNDEARYTPDHVSASITSQLATRVYANFTQAAL